MTISSIKDPISPFTTHVLEVGELMIEGQSYTVSVESRNPLISSPNNDTLAKIEYLVGLHLTHLTTQNVDISKILIQQIDEEGLSYVNDELEPKSMRSADVTFHPLNNSSNPFRPVYSIPLFQDGTISSVSDIYRSIIESLTRREEEAFPMKEFSNSRITFTSKSDPKVEDYVEDYTENEITELLSEESMEDETRGLLSGESKHPSEYEHTTGFISKFSNKILDIGSNIRNKIPKFDPKVEDYTENETPELLSEESMEDETRGLLSGESKHPSEYEHTTGFISKFSNKILDIGSNIRNKIPKFDPKVEDYTENETPELLSEESMEDETRGLLSGESKNPSEYEYTKGPISKLSNKISDIASNVGNRIPNLRQNRDNSPPLIKTSEMIKEEVLSFTNSLSESQKINYNQTASTSFIRKLQ